MNDVKTEVKEAACKCLTDCCDAIDNKDIEPLISSIITAIKNIDEVGECVQNLASTTFAQVLQAKLLNFVTF